MCLGFLVTDLSVVDLYSQLGIRYNPVCFDFGL